MGPKATGFFVIDYVNIAFSWPGYGTPTGSLAKCRIPVDVNEDRGWLL